MKGTSIYNDSIRVSHIVILLLTIIISFFVIASFTSSLKKEFLSIGHVNDNVQLAPVELFVQLISFENSYFGQALNEDQKTISFSKTLFETISRINFGDIRSLIGNELPGYAFFDTKILVPGIGTDYTNLPYESAPPLEELLQEREIAQKELEELKDEEPKTPPVSPTTEKNVFIYHSHSYESFLPLLGLTGHPDANKATDSKTNITIIGELLGKELEKKGIAVTVDKTNIGQELQKRGWKTNQAYDVSRNIVQSALAVNNEIEYMIDIHRDSARKHITTTMINNKPFARLFFVVGRGSKYYDENVALATAIHESLEKDYPGISRGIFVKGFSDGNGVYNQDLSPNILLIEMGGVDNDMKELKNTVEALVEVFNEHITRVEKVNGSH
jgi:stage II sporulation protein P